MIPAAFEYHSPKSVKEAVGLLQEHGRVGGRPRAHRHVTLAPSERSAPARSS